VDAYQRRTFFQTDSKVRGFYMDGLIANMQYVIGIVASFLFMALKKIPWVENNKQWFVPLTMIATCDITCAVNVYILHHLITNWIFTGTALALAICKVYDWISNGKSPE
jgi:hypothetical protein